MVNHDIAPDHERNGKGTAADADQAGNNTDGIAAKEHSNPSWKLARCPRLPVGEKLQRNEIKEYYEESFQDVGGEVGSEAGTEKGAD